MTKNKTKPRDMQALGSQSHHKRKMKKILKSMPILSKDQSTIKEALGKEMITNINSTLLTQMSLEELFHQENLSQTCTKMSLLAIFFLAIILVINK
jgi:hypothetical protein